MTSTSSMMALSESQKAAVESQAHRLAIIAPAGSGKTRVLTSRVAYLSEQGRIDQRHAIVATFTRRAASELETRLSEFGTVVRSCSTLHSLAWRLLQRWYDDNKKPRPNIVRSNKAFFISIFTRNPKFAETLSSDFGISKPNEVADEFLAHLAFKKSGSTIERKSYLSYELLRYLNDLYTTTQQRSKVIDLDDVIEHTVELLNVDRAFRERQTHIMRSFFIDEAQDLSPLQIKFLRSLCHDDANLCLVGDPNQSIYSWSGADSTTMITPEAHFGPIERVYLRESFRSTQQIVSASTSVLNLQTLEIDPRGGIGKDPEIMACEDQSAEAHLVTRLILQELDKGANSSDFAILTRTRKQLDNFRLELTKAGVSCLVRDETRNDLKPSGVTGAVSLATFHESKGLEWDTVFVCGMEDGLVPLRNDDYQSELQKEEEIRLAYVAMSRPKKRLVCTWARTRRNNNNQLKTRVPSPLLDSIAAASLFSYSHDHPSLKANSAIGAEIIDALGEVGNNGNGMTTALAVDPQRMMFSTEAPSPSVEFHEYKDDVSHLVGLHKQLLGWRKRRAQMANLKENDVISDHLLLKVATNVPRTLEDMLKLDTTSRARLATLAEPMIKEIHTYLDSR